MIGARRPSGLVIRGFILAAGKTGPGADGLGTGIILLPVHTWQRAMHLRALGSRCCQWLNVLSPLRFVFTSHQRPFWLDGSLPVAHVVIFVIRQIRSSPRTPFLWLGASRPSGSRRGDRRSILCNVRFVLLLLPKCRIETISQPFPINHRRHVEFATLSLAVRKAQPFSRRRPPDWTATVICPAWSADASP